MKTNQKRGFTLIELMIVVAIIGILAAIAIPNFIKFQARSKQGEAKANLKALFTAQKSYLQEKDRYNVAAGELGFSPERGNRYYYELAATGATADGLEDRAAAALVPGAYSGIQVDTFKFPFQADGTTATDAVPAFDIVGGVPNAGATGVYQINDKSEFMHSAVGNIDNDSAPSTGYDQWYISSESATITVEACTDSDLADEVPSGVPGNTNNDVNCE